MTPITSKQFVQSALTLGFKQEQVDKGAISGETGITDVTVMMKSVKDDLHNVMIDIPLEFYEFKDEEKASKYYEYVAGALQKILKKMLPWSKLIKSLAMLMYTRIITISIPVL